MAVKIRLRRMGNNNRPFFRIVATDERYATSGRFLETLGWYDPRTEGVNYELNVARVDYWKHCGAQLSNTVKSMFEKAKAAQPAQPASAPAAEAPDQAGAEG